MAGPLSYEPSIHGLLTDVFPADSRVVNGAAELRRRISWPVLARTTGLGEIEGGELVLVAPARVREVLPRLAALAEIGVAAVAVAATEFDLPEGASMVPIIALSPGTDLRRLQGEIERYITRRRRELFALDHELHRTLIDGAIAGREGRELLLLAAERAGTTLLVDRDGDVQVAPDGSIPLTAEDLAALRIASRETAGAVERAGPPAHLALPIAVGRERRGLAVLVSAGGSITDEHEAILTTLVRALAFTLGRERDVAVAGLADVLRSLPPDESMTWTALALIGDTDEREPVRALQAELRARDLRHVLGREGDALVALAAGSAPGWPALYLAVLQRMGSRTVRGAFSRPHRGDPGRSAAEALEALSRTRFGEIVSYEEVELGLLLASSARWLDFARGRLAPLLVARDDARELLETLRAYLAAGRNARQAAAELQVHRNTLLYRLRGIESRLDVSLNDPDTLFTLELALRALDFGTNPDAGSG